jgi:hypothetical protein
MIVKVFCIPEYTEFSCVGRDFLLLINIVTYPGFAWLIRRGLDMMIEFIGPLHNWLQQFTNPYLEHWTISTSDHTSLLHYFVVLLPVFWLCPLITTCSARTPWKIPSSVVNNACLLVHYLAMDVVPLLSAYASGIRLSSRCLAMGICVTVLYCSFMLCCIASRIYFSQHKFCVGTLYNNFILHMSAFRPLSGMHNKSANLIPISKAWELSYSKEHPCFAEPANLLLQILSSEADSCWACQEITKPLKNPKNYYCMEENP